MQSTPRMRYARAAWDYPEYAGHLAMLLSHLCQGLYRGTVRREAMFVALGPPAGNLRMPASDMPHFARPTENHYADERIPCKRYK